MAKLLIIEDEPLMVSGLRDNFEYEGYEVITACDGSEGLNRALSEFPDLILLDVMLPKISGLDICLNVKAKQPRIPIIMLTARFQISDRVVGLELGADDYVTKPFSIRELSARVKALLRRVQAHPKQMRITGSPCKLDCNPKSNTKPFFKHLRTVREHLRSRSGIIDQVVGPGNVQSTPESGPLALAFAEMPVMQEDAMIGRQLGPYRILSRIGCGGMGVVYMAIDERLHRRVALKGLNARRMADHEARHRLLQEAQNASFLNHPNICTIYDIEEVADEIYVVMELVDGQPLSRLIVPFGLPIRRVIDYGLQVAGALAHAHAHGVIHRDLKSQNVVIRRDGLAKILDFGLSARVEDSAIDAVTRSLGLQNSLCVVVGTVQYAAPEVLRGQKPDARSDIWSFGVMLYESVAGALPFRGETAYSLSAAILHQSPEPLSSRTPLELGAIIDRCLSKDTEQRYAQFDEVAEQLRRVSQDFN
jgi:serine/threonine protein kinase/CheY-like chemotaxis protein